MSTPILRFQLFILCRLKMRVQVISKKSFANLSFNDFCRIIYSKENVNGREFIVKAYLQMQQQLHEDNVGGPHGQVRMKMARVRKTRNGVCSIRADGPGIVPSLGLALARYTTRSDSSSRDWSTCSNMEIRSERRLRSHFGSGMRSINTDAVFAKPPF